MLCNILISLLAVGSPLQLDENDIRLAIDITARELQVGQSVTLQPLDRDSTQAIMQLIEDHPSLTAVLAEDGCVQIVRVK